MDENSFNYIKIFILLILSAFFSGSETAFFSLSKIHVKKLEKSKKSLERRIFRLLKKPHDLLITILLGNTIVNVAASSTAAIIALKIAKNIENVKIRELILPIEMVLMSIVILIIGEITPKLFAFSKAERFAKISGIFIEIIKIPLWPIIKILSFISHSLTHKQDKDKDDTNKLTSEDFHNLISSQETKNTLVESEKKIIHGIFKFSSTEAKEIMIPRVDIKAVQLTDSKEHMIDTINTYGHSRLPIYDSSIDNILGFIYAKDLLLYPDKTISALMRNPFFVSENTNIQVLLNHFQTNRIHIAIIVDEYGGTSGLITLEDILEILVGEIFDEYDNEEFILKKLSDNEYILSGMFLISKLNEKFNLDIDEEKHDNLGSFLYDEFNKVPSKNEFILYNNVKFTITSLQKRRIKYAKITLPDNNFTSI